MYSVYLICAYVTLISFSNGITLVETQNKCGCYQDKCPKTYKPRCITSQGNYDDLFLQNTAYSKSPEVCNKWFLEGYKENLIVSENGTLQITLVFSSFLTNKFSFELQLRYNEQCRNFGVNNNFYLLEKTHSIEHGIALGTSDASCKKKIDVSFSYVFSGCYQLYINNTTNPDISGGCMSKPFTVTSSYIKELLNELNVQSLPSYLSQSELLKFSYSGEGLNRPQSIVIRLHYTREGRFIVVKETHLTSAAKDGCCYTIERDSSLPKNMSDCPCIWANNNTLECKYYGLKNGNYCLIVELIDPRCQKSTLWTESWHCSWSSKSTIEGDVKSIEVVLKKPDDENGDHHVLILSIYLIAMIIIITFILVVLKFVEKKRRYILGNLAIMEKSCFINEECEILLLYPRDCEEFMIAIEQFRILLKESYSCKVHDPWEEEMFDKVAESLETWTWPLIENPNIKIIVVLSECSKLMEEAFIDDKHSVVYRDRNVFDNIFGSSLKHVYLHFATRSDSYQRVFVVRLDEAPALNWSFHFNCATVYILPHCLDSLIKDLYNGCSITINKEKNEKLKTALHNYQTFKQRNPNYLNEILEVNNNHKSLI